MDPKPKPIPQLPVAGIADQDGENSEDVEVVEEDDAEDDAEVIASDKKKGKRPSKKKEPTKKIKLDVSYEEPPASSGWLQVTESVV